MFNINMSEQFSYSLSYVSTSYYGNDSNGKVRFNFQKQQFEARSTYSYDSWIPLKPYLNIGLKPEYALALEWAREQRERQQKIEQYISRYPSVQAQLDEVNLAQEKLDFLINMVSENITKG
jgi:hypothetical protein